MLKKNVLKVLATSMVVILLFSSNLVFAEESNNEEKTVTEVDKEAVEDSKEDESEEAKDIKKKEYDGKSDEIEDKLLEDEKSLDLIDDIDFNDEVAVDGIDEGSEEVVKEDEESIEDALEDKEITAEVANHKIKISGKMPADTEVVVKEIKDYESVTNSVERSLPSKMGFYEITSFDIEFSYMEEGEKKQFVPADFDETYTVTVSNIGRSESVSVYSINGDSKSLGASGTDEAIFPLSDATSVTVGITYECNSAICGRAPKGTANKKISALGSRVQYTTKSDSRGNYLITGVDYSKAHAGCCFEIVSE